MTVQVSSTSVAFAAETTKDVDVSSELQDARECVFGLYDSSGNVVLGQLTAISATTIRITFGFAQTDTYKLLAIGSGVIAAAEASSETIISDPTIDQLKTYADLRDKIELDLDLRDETFIEADEMIGYVNEGLEEAETEILKIDEDYFLDKYYIPLVEDQAAYSYPSNIYAYKVRGILYSNGSTIYEVKKFRRKDKFSNIAFATQFNAGDDYMWYHTNESVGGPKINLLPASREDAIVPPLSDSSTPMVLWYIRHANRVPLTGQYVRHWDQMDSETNVDPSTNKIITSSTYVTGDKVKLTTSDAMPGGLTSGTIYYVIASTDYIKLATTLQLARAGTAIDITSSGSGVLSIAIAATSAIIDATVIDIPEYTKFILQWAKCRAYEKLGDPRLAGAVAIAEQQREKLKESFKEIQVDDNNENELDLSSYQEMS